MNNPVHARFMHHKPTPRRVLSLTDALFVGSFANGGNLCRRTCMRRILDLISGGLEIPLTCFLLYFYLSFCIFCPSVYHSKSLLMFENMIMIKRTTEKLRLSDPAMPAPSGMHSNFVNPSNLKTECLVLVIFCLILSTFVVSMRMWTKTRLVRKVVLEDCKSVFFRLSLLNFVY